MTETGPYVIYAHEPLDPNGHSHLDAAHEKHQFQTRDVCFKGRRFSLDPARAAGQQQHCQEQRARGPGASRDRPGPGSQGFPAAVSALARGHAPTVFVEPRWASMHSWGVLSGGLGAGARGLPQLFDSLGLSVFQ